MKTAIVSLIMFSIGVPAAMASTTTCPTATYDQYLAPNFSCISGNLLFSSFGYTGTANPAGLMMPPTGIMVTPQTVTNNEGFQFSSGWSVASQNGVSIFQDSLITFTISTIDGSATIDDLALMFNGSVTGTGVTGVTEQYCLGGSIANCPQATNVVNVTNPPPVFNGGVTFSPVSTLSVSKDINVTSGGNGTAFTSQVINDFSQLSDPGPNVPSQVPEPMSYVLLGSGLLAIGLLRKRMCS